MSKEEVMAFVESEIACPVKSKEASDRLLQAMASYDNAAAVDLRNFTEIVLNSDVAEALLVAEFASQIKNQGVACVKVSPTSSAVWKSNMQLRGRRRVDGVGRPRFV